MGSVHGPAFTLSATVSFDPVTVYKVRVTTDAQSTSACRCSTCSPNRTDSPLATDEGLTHGHPATWRVGAREALGAPAFVLGVGYVGYGSLAQSHGFSLFETGLSTIAIWALPGQLILVEMQAAGAPFLAILFAVAFSASRFLPMAVTLIPHLRVPGDPPWRYYFAGHVLAMTSWAVAMRRFPEQPVPARLPYFLGFAMTLWLVSLGCTLFGHSLAGTLPAPLRLAFIFANPLYFILILTANLRDRMGAIALLCGAVAGPALHLVVPAWSVVGGGVLGGSLAYLIARRL